jgi:hypothetical protein
MVSERMTYVVAALAPVALVFGLAAYWSSGAKPLEATEVPELTLKEAAISSVRSVLDYPDRAVFEGVRTRGYGNKAVACGTVVEALPGNDRRTPPQRFISDGAGMTMIERQSGQIDREWLAAGC